ANSKFDYKWLNFRYGLDIPFFNFDVILAEHILEEDKKGEYGLKKLTKDYLPELGGYDASLEDALQSIQKELDQEAEQKINEALQEYFTTWQEISEQERKELLTGWVKEGHLMLPDTNGLEKIKTVQQGRKKVVAKTYLKKLFKIIRKLPPEILDIPNQKARKVNYGDLPKEVLLPYAAMDALVTRKIFIKQYKKMQQDAQHIDKLGVTENLMWAMERMTMPLTPKIAEMEYKGIRLDRERAEQYLCRIDEKLPELQEKIFSSIGRKINLSSSAPGLKKVLFEEKKYVPTIFTETDSPSTGEDAMNVLFDEYQDELLKDLVAHRKIEKVRNTYIRNWLKYSEYDGKVHFSLNQHGTVTHRLSSDNGLQNAPAYLKEMDLNIKALFLPDSEDLEFYDLDIANAEMRVLCAYSQDEFLIEAFNQGMDIHSLTASKISEYSYEDIKAGKEDKTSEQHKLRQLGKKINFGTVYSMGAKKLSKQLWSESRVSVSQEEAQEYLDKFFNEYPQVKKYMDDTKAFANKHKFVYTYTGRKRRLPMIGSGQDQKFRAQRQAINC
ncbi:MAG: DNA polymerase, partial [Desulfonatronovibrio sp.]